MNLRHLALATLLPLTGCAELADAVSEALTTPTGAYVENVTLLTLPPTSPSGAPWDQSGPPDPYIVVHSSRGDELFRGERVRDALPAAYPLRWPVGATRVSDLDEVLVIDVYDDDLAADDHVARYYLALQDYATTSAPSTVPLLGPNREPMGEVTLRWIMPRT